MGRPRKPTAVLELSGAFRKNPARGRARQGEPKGKAEIGPPPADFLKQNSSTAAKRLEIWYRLLAEAPAGCITGSDHTLLANACRLQAEIELGYAKLSAHAQMDRYLTQLGCTGEGRAKLATGKKEPAAANAGSPWRELAEEAREARVQ